MKQLLKETNDKTFSDFIEDIKNGFVIYGAGVIAFNIAKALRTLYQIIPDGYFVTKVGQRSNIFANIKPMVFSYKKWNDMKKPFILVATPESYHAEISVNLQKEGIKKYALVNSMVQYQIMSLYFQKIKGFRLIGEAFDNQNLNPVEAYMAVSQWDKPLKAPRNVPPYILPVHAGSYAAGDLPIGLNDDFNGGISERNYNYAELTVTYWAWKQRSMPYKGICHYRRWLELAEANILWMQMQDVDAVLPLPYLCNEQSSEQYLRYIDKTDIHQLFEVIRDIYPEKKSKFEKNLQRDYLYNHNILLAKECVFDEYCTFLFSVLFEVERRNLKIGAKRKDRYLGYLGELLTSLYFTENEENLKIAHAPLVMAV